MRTQVTPQTCNSPGRIPAASMIVPCLTAMLLTWGASSIGGTNDIPAPAAVLSAMLAPAYEANEVLVDAGRAEADATAGICPEWGASPARGESGARRWCTGQSSGEQTEVATFLEWHVQARHLAQSGHQITLSAQRRPNALTEEQLTALALAAPLWVAFAR